MLRMGIQISTQQMEKPRRTILKLYAEDKRKKIIHYEVESLETKKVKIKDENALISMQWRLCWFVYIENP